MIFTFFTLTFNQENYIFEHLESIKYQILNFGSQYRFQLIIADDCSVDKTIEYIEYWVSINSHLFYRIDIVTDIKNRGTCFNFTKVWELIKGDSCKVCAGDDVYSKNDIFKYFDNVNDQNFLSGVPLYLIDGLLSKPKSIIFNIFACEIIYKKKSFKKRLENISILNTPNTIIPIEHYKNKNIFNFIRNFSVTEDFPMHIKMSEEKKSIQFKQIPAVFIYYRRTNNSIYIIRSEEFNNDKIKIFDYLISNTDEYIQRFLLRNRKYCFKTKNKYFKILYNLNYIKYGLEIIFNIHNIWKAYNSFEIDIVLHQKYMNTISRSARLLRSSYDDSK